MSLCLFTKNKRWISTKNIFPIIIYKKKMLLSLDGILSIIAALVNIYTVTGLLGLGTENTQRYAKHPFVKLIFIFCFCFSVIPQKMPCLIATGLFFVFEVRNFIEESSKKAIEETIDSTQNVIDKFTNE